MISKYNVGLKKLLGDGISEPEFYGDLVYKFIGRNDFSFQFRKIITRYRRIGYNLNVMRQSACLVFNPITVCFCFFCSEVIRRPGIFIVGQLTEYVESSFLIHQDVYRDLSVCSL